MDTNKDLLKLENEYRDEIIRPREKPKITRMDKPIILAKKISDFLDKTSRGDEDPQSNHCDNRSANHHVEMDILISEQDNESD